MRGISNKHCLLPFFILVISRFGFEGWICVLIASVPDLGILYTSIANSVDCNKAAHPVEMKIHIKLCCCCFLRFV